ncbi:lactosylceramide 1,3-N-acetyl-beta-D-glucosaminyltransferase A-like [Daphnia pulex]|uniref:lactosylceramide 1,3-N-acetyl-beta-D-glucosaminyltransferase A-like n=1 Tax=Daphnia pulex TaxID=6669 RepID=UPI001EDFB3EC|nr:lactosylceramide 1,3-N-acetyl-beta-D-glucosaminyltransferase A-like [Daphnia pulex]
MHRKFIFVSLWLTLTVFIQLLPSASSNSTPSKEQIPAAPGQKFVWPGCHEEKKRIDQIVGTINAWFGCNNEKKRIDQLVGTIDALQQQIPAKNTLADMENALRREKAKNQELIANLELCEEKRKMFNNYVLDSFLRNSPYSGVENYTRYLVARLGMLPIKNAKPLIPEFGPVINDVLSFRYPINIPSCPAAEITNNTSANPSVFIAIISAPGNFKERNDIRATWLIHLKNVLEKNLLGISTRYGFFLGQTQDDSIQKGIKEESRKHGDIIQIEMDDSYRNLTFKGIAVLNWVRQHCAKVDLVFKVDDDIYVNVHNLVHFVRSNYQSNNSLFGLPSSEDLTLKRYKKLGSIRYYNSFEEYPWSNYPDNGLSGPAYFMHTSVVIPILAASQTIPFHPSDEIFLTGMCTEKASLKIRNSRPEYTWNLKPPYSEGQPSVYNPYSLGTIPTPCYLRNYVGLETENQFNTHSAVDDFYRNKTQCVINKVDGTKRTIDFTAPIIFKFT